MSNAPAIGLNDSLLGGFTEQERERIRRGENFAIWKYSEIARCIERSVRHVHEVVNRDFDPLPLEWEGGRPFVAAWNLISWRQNQRRAHKYHREIERVEKEKRGSKRRKVPRAA